jgi:hypothetical protein
MARKSLTPLRIGIAVAAFAALVIPLPATADSFSFTTGSPDGLMATTSRPSSARGIETETADDFTLNQTVSITGATFTGLVPSINSKRSCGVRILRKDAINFHDEQIRRHFHAAHKDGAKWPHRHEACDQES